MALAANSGEQTLVELSQQFDVHVNQTKQWKDQLLEAETGVFGDEAKAEPAGPTVDVKTLQCQDRRTDVKECFIRCARHLQYGPGSQFTSIDGRGAWRDNVFVERLWRSIKYEEAYLHGYNSVPEARAWIGRYLRYYNTPHPHSSLVTCSRQLNWNFPIMPRLRAEENSMKKTKFTEAQIAFILKQAEDGVAVAEVCRKAGISDATFSNWRKKYAGLMPSEMRRLRQLEGLRRRTSS